VRHQGFVRAEESLEEPGPGLGRDADAVVCHLDHDLAAAIVSRSSAAPNLDPAVVRARVGVFDRVGEKVR
jgi:hypothetical protein